MPKTVVLKMRGIKKILGNEMLQLAIMLSLLRVDPDALLFGASNHSSGDLEGDLTGDVWTQTRIGDLFGSFGFGDLSPRLHPKSLDSMVERFHSEILEDLNNLGRYNRIRSYNGAPVEISAFIVNTDVPHPLSSQDNNSIGGDSDSGISGSDSSDAGESDHEDQARPEFDEGAAGLSPFFDAGLIDSELELVGDPRDVLGAIGDFLADPEDLENELVHIDDQLITIEDNLEEISDEFLYLDEQLAVHIEQEENGGFLAAEILNNVAYDANPFDQWQIDENIGLDELNLVASEAFDSRKEEGTKNGYASAAAASEANGEEDVGCRNGSIAASSKFSCFPSTHASHTGTIYANNNNDRGGSLGPREGSGVLHPIVPSAAENQLWTVDGKFEQASLDDLFRSPQGYPEGLLRNASLHNPSAAANDSFPQGASGGADELGFGQSAANLTANSTTQTAAEEQQSVDSFLGLHSTTDSEIIKDIISVLGGRDLHETENASLWGRNSGSHHASHHLHNNNVDEERAVNVTDFSPDESHHGFAGFHSSAQNAAAAAPIALALPPGYAGYHPYMSVAAAAVRSSQQYTPLTNHTYAAAASNAMSLQQQMDDLETASYTSGKSNRSKDFSFDSDSIKQDPDGCAAERLRQSRDERKAREIGIQFSIHDIINLPMDEFNDMLSRHELNEEQLNMCRDIRRRGKNKVAAQNCRKRKIDQIAHLEVQVNEARARKRQLLDERQQLYRQREEWRNKLSIIEEDVLLGMNKNGKEFALDLSSSDVRIVRRQVPAQGAATSANSSERIDPRFQTLTSTSYHGRYVWKGSSSGGGNS